MNMNILCHRLVGQMCRFTCISTSHSNIPVNRTMNWRRILLKRIFGKSMRKTIVNSLVSQAPLRKFATQSKNRCRKKCGRFYLVVATIRQREGTKIMPDDVDTSQIRHKLEIAHKILIHHFTFTVKFIVSANFRFEFHLNRFSCALISTPPENSATNVCHSIRGERLYRGLNA